jgi:hypothetical protein
MPIAEGVQVPLVFQNTPLAQVWYDAYIESVGSEELALVAVQQHADYETYFPGNRRDDGSIRWEEGVYRSIEESYALTLSSYGIAPGVFQDKFGDMIATDVAPDEFSARVDNLYTRVIDTAPAIAQWYADNLGIEVTMQGILASFMDRNIADSIWNKEITMAEIGGEAATRGFQIVTDMADMLFEAGVDDRSEARQLFAVAEATIPVLNVLAARHADPDDTFDLTEFVQGEVMADPFQMRRVRRLQAQEGASFTAGVGQSGLLRGAEGVGLTGLETR